MYRMYIKVYHLIEITSTLILTHRQAYPSQPRCTWSATSSCVLQTPSPTGCTSWVPHTTSSWRQPGRSSGPGQSRLCRPPSGGEEWDHRIAEEGQVGGICISGPVIYIRIWLHSEESTGHKKNAMPALTSTYSIVVFTTSTKTDDCSCINSEEEMQDN